MDGIDSKARSGAGAGAGVWWFLALLLVLALLCNGSRGLWAPDEGRYVTGALEMLRRHDFVGIFLNDEWAHFTKPPMTYWTIAAAIAAFGQSEFAARLPNALAYVATVLLLWPAGKLLTPRMPSLPMILYATMWLPFIAASAITTDTLLALFTTLAGVSFLHFNAGIRPRGAAVCMWLGFGLAFLTKGPPGLLALPAFLVWLVLRRDWNALKRLVLSWGLPLFVVVGFGWFILAETRFPGLLRYLIGAEVAGRVASDAFHRNSQWYGALAVFVPTLLIGAFPWLPAWLMFGRHRKLSPPLKDSADRLLLLWIGLPLTVFALAESRLPLYLLPLFAPLALWLARRLEPVASVASRRQVGWAIGGCLAVALVSKLSLGMLSPVENDTRAAARMLAELAQGPVRDVVYVDLTAMWGMRFYLGAQVREARLRRRPYAPAFLPARTFTGILASDGASLERLFVVNPRSTTQFEQAVWKGGLCPERLGNDAITVIYRVAPMSSPACTRDVDGQTDAADRAP